MWFRKSYVDIIDRIWPCKHRFSNFLNDLCLILLKNSVWVHTAEYEEQWETMRACAGICPGKETCMTRPKKKSYPEISFCNLYIINSCCIALFSRAGHLDSVLWAACAPIQEGSPSLLCYTLAIAETFIDYDVRFSSFANIMGMSWQNDWMKRVMVVRSSEIAESKESRESNKNCSSQVSFTVSGPLHKYSNIKYHVGQGITLIFVNISVFKRT